MKLETDPITDDEWLLRRVPKDRFRTDKTPVISLNAFEPRIEGPKVRDPDTDGISLYREACLTAPDVVLTTLALDKQPNYGIVRLQVAFIKSLKLTVEIKLDDRILGHVVIPEMNSMRYEDKQIKESIKQNMLKLAEEASKIENIVREPQITGSKTSPT